MSLAGRDETVDSSPATNLPTFILEPKVPPMLHAILVDGMIERIEGTADFADAEMERRREAGYSSAYLFAARNDKEFERKRKVRPLQPHASASAK
jgi:hypothetical protein